MHTDPVFEELDNLEAPAQFPMHLGKGVLVGRKAFEAMAAHYEKLGSIQVVVTPMEPRPDYERIVANIAKHGLKYDDPWEGLRMRLDDPEGFVRGTATSEPIRGVTVEQFRNLITEANKMRAKWLK